MSIFETGLYGQSERDFSARADDNRQADVMSEGTGYKIPTEAEYVEKMAAFWMQELASDEDQDRLVEAYDAIEDKSDLQWEMMYTAIGMSREEQQRALDGVASIYEEMLTHGFDQHLRYRVMSVSLPRAVHLMKEKRLRRHPNAKKPSSRIRCTPPEIYNLDTSPKKYGEDEFLDLDD